MSDKCQIIELYSELAEQPSKDFGWKKGPENAKAHGYSSAWFKKLPSVVWEYCAAVGNPFELGDIKEGSTVLDLGCGAGVDLLVSALKVGQSGKVIGVDITPKMVEKAKEHAKLAGFSNIQVLQSSFDSIGIEDESVDVVISNGAINLTSCKESVFAEIYRVLKPEGKLMFADMIDIAEDDTCCSSEKDSCCSSEGEDWANCVAGTLREDELISIIKKAGFDEVECVKLTHYTTAETTSGALFRAKKIASKELRKSHWNTLFETKDYTKVLWHQSSPTFSLDLIKEYSNRDDTVIDVGCGASLLVDGLISEGYKEITLLDTSERSLEIVKSRLGDNSEIPTYICRDIVGFRSDKKFDIWHDRALFHFLLLEKEREEYFEILRDSLKPGGVAIINTFAPDGESVCAGLSTCQYDDRSISDELIPGLELIRYEQYTHITPKKTKQAYSSLVIKKI